MAYKFNTPITEFTVKARNLPHLQIPGALYFITFRTWKNYQLNDTAKQVLYDSILFADNKKCKIIAFVIMDDHVHLILSATEMQDGSYYNLSEILKSIKSYAAHSIKKHLTDASKSQTRTSELLKIRIFQNESFDRIIRNEEELLEKISYIVNNPVKKGLISNGYEYRWYYFSKTYGIL